MDPMIDAIFGVVQFCAMPTLLAGIRTAIDLDLFELGESVWLLEDVAAKKNIDPVLLQRLLRLLCSFNIFEQTDRQCFGPSPLSRALANPPLRDWVKFNFDVSLPITQSMPTFLRSTSYRNPDGDPQSPAKSVLGCEFFEYLHQHPAHGQAFDSAMKISEIAPPITIPVFPYKEQALAAATETHGVPLFLDIGGGQGQFVEKLVADMPDISCEFVVQDLEPTTAAMKVSSPKIRGMVHDFFEPQPIEGARWCNFRRVLHDWPDSACRRILAATGKAMRKGCSTLLIQEYVIPEKGYSQVEALIDFGMAITTGMERTEDQWRKLLESEGFRIVRIWPAQIGALCIIEAEPV